MESGSVIVLNWRLRAAMLVTFGIFTLMYIIVSEDLGFMGLILGAGALIAGIAMLKYSKESGEE